jgi:hypothetical protein
MVFLLFLLFVWVVTGCAITFRVATIASVAKAEDVGSYWIRMVQKMSRGVVLTISLTLYPCKLPQEKSK